MKSPTLTTRGPGPRLSYDATVAALADGGVPPEQHLPLWQLLVARHLQDWRPRGAKKTGARMGRPGWTAEAAALITPLRYCVRDLNGRRSTFHMRFRGLCAVDKQGIEHDLCALFDAYVGRCEVLLDHIRTTLKAYGHLSNDSTGSVGMTLAEVVQDMRTQGRPAGKDHWSQWEDPATLRRIRYLLSQAFDVYQARYDTEVHGRRWYAYDHGLKGQRAREEWEAAFKKWRFDAARAGEPLPLDNAAVACWLRLLNSPRLRQAMDDAMHAQRALGRTPKGYPSGDCWRALPLDMRSTLAHMHQDIINEQIGAGLLPSTTVTHYTPDEDELKAAGLQA